MAETTQSSAEKAQAIAKNVEGVTTGSALRKTDDLPAQQTVDRPMPFGGEVELLISQAIDKNVPVETMEKLLAMRRELRAERAKEEYDRAMAAFQAECPTIKKTKIVYERDGKKERYRYAPLESIVEQVKAPLAKHGFSYSITTVQDEKMFGVTCRSTHRMGHSEETTFSVPIGSEAYMSDVQKYGARLTFAKRYAFCNAFGILTGDEDTDAVMDTQPKAKAEYAVTPPKISEKQIKYIHTLLEMKGKPKEPIYEIFKIKSITELNAKQASTVIERLQQYPDIDRENFDLNEIDKGIQAQMAEEAGA